MAPPPRLHVFSMVTSVVGAQWWSAPEMMHGSTWAAVKTPFWPGSGDAVPDQAADFLLMPRLANLLRNFSTRPPRLSTLFCVPV